MSTLKVDQLEGSSGNTITVPTGSTIVNLGTATGFGGAGGPGSVLQTVIGSNLAASDGTHVLHTATPSTWTTIVSCAITPSADTSQIAIWYTVNIGGSAGSFALNILRGSQVVGQANAWSDPMVSDRIRAYTSSGYMQPNDCYGFDEWSTVGTYSGQYLDDISTLTAWTSGEITYYIKMSLHPSKVYRINRTYIDGQSTGQAGRSSSHVLLQEIAG
jgi:hypothetical protein